MQTLSLSNKKHTPMMFSVRRHIRGFFNHITVRKLINISICGMEMLLRRHTLISHPFYMRIEVSPYCNLHCSGCLLGGASLSETNPAHRKEKIMSFDLFKDSVADFLPYLIKVNLYDEGEPLLNKALPQMIKYLRVRGISTCVCSNFSLDLSDAYLERLLFSGLNHLIVAVDGATPETYSMYRKGGDLSLVIRNLETLMNMKKRLGKDGVGLKVEVQFLEFSHNKHERESVRALAARLGVETFTIIEDCSTKGWDGYKFTGPETERRKKGCYYLYVATTINSIGEMGTCDYGEDHGMPNIGIASKYAHDRLRNHPNLVDLRRSFSSKSHPLNAICRNCSLAIK